jgi:hypothetical protein
MTGNARASTPAASTPTNPTTAILIVAISGHTVDEKPISEIVRGEFREWVAVLLQP